MEFLNLTRHVEIGANCYALTLAGRTVILDSGMHPKQEGARALPDLASSKARRRPRRRFSSRTRTMITSARCRC